MYVSTDPNDVKFARVNADADGDNTIIVGVAGKRFRVLGYQLIASGAGLVSVKDSTPATLAELQFAANALTVAYAGGHLAPAFETATGKDLVLGTQAAQDVNGHLTYVEVIA